MIAPWRHQSHQDGTDRTEIAIEKWLGFDEFYQIWWIFFGWVLFLCLSIEKWYYIFVWKLRKCEEQEENVFSILFSVTQPNTRKYFFRKYFEMQPNTKKYFPFLKIAFPKNIYFPKNILHKPNTALLMYYFSHFAECMLCGSIVLFNPLLRGYEYLDFLLY